MDAAEKEAEAARDDAGDADWYAHEAGVHTKTAGRQILVGPWDYLDAALGAHLVRHDPAAVLRRIRAERKVLAECEAAYHWDNWGASSLADVVVQGIAEGWGWTEET
jgi:hypothetical protein